MEKNIKISENQKKEIKLNNELNTNFSQLHNPIKLKPKDESNKDIEKMENLIKEGEVASTPKKITTKKLYTRGVNTINLIKDFSKQINSQKKDALHLLNKKINDLQKQLKNVNDQSSPKKISPIYYKSIQNLNKKKLMHKSKSSSTFNSSQKIDMESNFMKLGNEANIYTANADYIQNKKVLLFDKYNYDNNVYKPDRAKLFDMTRMLKMPKKDSFIYKTINFRVGHLINESNNTYDFGKNMGLNNISSYDFPMKNKGFKNLYKNQEHNKILNFRNYNNSINSYNYIDKNLQKNKSCIPSDTFYRQIMEKKNESYQQYLKGNVDLDKEKEVVVEDFSTSDYNNINSYINVNNLIKDDQEFLKPYYKNDKNKKKPEMKQLYYKQILKNSQNDLNGYSPLLSKKLNEMGQPIYYPKIFSSYINFDNYSQKERFEKISESFEGLKKLMETFKKQGELDELDFIFEYALSKNIDKNLLTIKNLNNFYNFLNEKPMPLDSNKSLKENIILALNYDMNLTKKQKIKKNVNKTFSKKKKDTKINIKNKNKINELKENKKLMFDLDLQKKVNNQKNFSFDKTQIRDNLKKELEQIKKNLINKQKLVLDARSSEEKIKNYKRLFDLNERLYYTWYKHKNEKDLNNFRQQSKLTELYFYNKTKEDIKTDVFEKEYLSKKLQNLN